MPRIGALTPDWVLNVLLALFGVVVGVALLLVSLRYHYRAVWSGFGAGVLLVLIITLYLHNALNKRDARHFEATIPTYFGKLVPAKNAQLPMEFPPDLPDTAVVLFLGDTVAMSSQRSEGYSLLLEGVPILTIAAGEEGLVLSANVTDALNEGIVKITDNQFDAPPNRSFTSTQPSPSELCIYDKEGVEVFGFQFLSPRAMRVVGRLHSSGVQQPLIIRPDFVRVPGGLRMKNVWADDAGAMLGSLALLPRRVPLPDGRGVPEAQAEPAD